MEIEKIDPDNNAKKRRLYTTLNMRLINKLYKNKLNITKEVTVNE